MIQSKLLTMIAQQRPRKKSELAKHLNIRNKEKREFYQLLEQMEKDGLIFSDEKERYRVIDGEKYCVGKVQTTAKGFGFLLQEDSDDIFLSASNLNSALNGDEVIVKKYRDSSGERPEGKVIRILQRKTEKLVGTFQDRRNFGFVVADEQKFAQDIYIPKKYMRNAKDGQKVQVRIVKWPEKNKKPEGEIVEILGYPDEPRVDILSIAKNLDIPMEFPKSALSEARGVPQEVAKEELNKRKDLRNTVTFTIDGADSKDFDDAVSISKNDRGNYVLGVHIADVSHYVKEHSSLDKEAFKRGNSVYLLNEVIPMLPEELSNGICSLNEGVERLTLSCVAEVDQKGKVVNHHIDPTVIRSHRRLVYDHVSDFLELGQKHKSVKGLEEELRQMEELSFILQKVRQNRGAVDFDIPEPKITLDKEGHPLEVKREERRTANKMIEEFMLLANQIVAEHFYRLKVPFLYRIHEEPTEEKIADLNQYIRPFGYHVDEEVEPRDIQQLVEGAKGKKEEMFISTLTLRSMQKARYSADNDIHFGLAYQYYTHFTSPIRRYSDLIVHRIVKGNLEHRGNKLPIEELRSIAEHVSATEKTAQEAERQVLDVKMAQYMANHIGEKAQGIISGVTSFGFFVQLDNLIEGLVRYESMQDYFVFEENEYAARNTATGQMYSIGDRVNIRVVNVNMTLGQIDFALEEEEDGKKS